MELNFEKNNGLIPVIIQDNYTLQVLMLGFMNEEALAKTIAEKKVTFFSRTKKRLWQKGESSGHFLIVDDIKSDCDKDTLLIKVTPQGPTCHTGNTSCFNQPTAKGFIYQLQKIILNRLEKQDDSSYISNLFNKGINKITQKFGEEAIELIIEAKDNDDNLFKNEAADLLFHFLVLLNAKNIKFEEIEEVLWQRSLKKNK